MSIFKINGVICNILTKWGLIEISHIKTFATCLETTEFEYLMGTSLKLAIIKTIATCPDISCETRELNSSIQSYNFLAQFFLTTT